MRGEIDDCVYAQPTLQMRREIKIVWEEQSLGDQEPKKTVQVVMAGQVLSKEP